MRAVGAVAVLAGAAAVFASPSPTGIEWLDVVYRVGFALIITLAGSRARRWALIVAAIVVSVGSLGPALLAGAAALALGVFLVGRNRRDRVWGAAVGALVSVAAMNMSLDFFQGDSALLAAGAFVVLCASGYRNSGSLFRRMWRWALGVTCGLAVLGSIAAAVATATAAGPLLDGVEATKSGVSALQDADRAAATASLGEASRRFAVASDRANALWAQLGRAVPVVSQNLVVVQQVSRSGATLTAAARDIAAEVDYEQLRLADGGVNLDALRLFRDPLMNAVAALESADAAVGGLDSPWQLAPLSDRVEEFRAKVGDLHRQTAIAALAVDRAPAMLGADGERHYLMLLGNPAEARDLGGHLGNWAELDAVGGQLQLVSVGSPGDLTLDSSQEALATLDAYPPSLSEMKPLAFPQNWGSSPDMAEVARLSADLYEQKTARRIDGVFYADPVAFAQFLSITGPIPIPALGREVSQADAAQFLTSTQFAVFGTETMANEAVTQLVQDVFDRLTRAHLPGPKALAELLRPAVLEGRFKFYSLVEADQPLLAAIGIDGVLPVPEEGDGDVLGVINRNANPSKIDTFLHRSTEVEVNWDLDTGEVFEEVAVTLRNEAPGVGMPELIIGNQSGFPPGTNLTDVALLSGYELTEATLDGEPVVTRPVYDGRYWRDTVRVALGPGQTRVLRYSLIGSVAPSDTYSVFVVGQPLVNEGEVTLRIRPTEGTVVGGRGLTVDAEGVTLRVRDDANTAVSIRVRR